MDMWVSRLIALAPTSWTMSLADLQLSTWLFRGSQSSAWGSSLHQRMEGVLCQLGDTSWPPHRSSQLADVPCLQKHSTTVGQGRWRA